MKNAPCYCDGNDCPKRSETCHAQCEEYLDWFNELQTERKAGRKNEADVYAIELIRKNRRGIKR